MGDDSESLQQAIDNCVEEILENYFASSEVSRETTLDFLNSIRDMLTENIQTIRAEMGSTEETSE